MASVYNVGTGNQTDPEISSDGGQDIYSTTGVLNLQLDVLHGVLANYTTSIHNRYYNSLAWTSNFGAAAIVSCLYANVAGHDGASASRIDSALPHMCLIFNPVCSKEH